MEIESVKVISSALVAAFGLMLPAFAVGWIGSKAMEATGRNPEASSKIASNMILAIAFAEGLGIFALVVSLIIKFV